MKRLLRLSLPLSLALLGCDGQQYVSPDKVGLTVTNDRTNVLRVSKCHFIPVLLGSEVRARYEIEDDLRVTITLTRDELELSYQDPSREWESFSVTTDTFEESTTLTADNPPDGYTVELTAPCTPGD